MVTSSTSPISPAAIRARIARKAGIETAVEAGQERHARGLHHPISSRIRSDDMSTGFSQKIALPAFALFSIRSKCVSVGVPITTASMSGLAMISSERHHPRARFFGKRVGRRGKRIGDGGHPRTIDMR
jgi:hypothetical protein